MKVGVIVQARMGSTRLPGKVLAAIDDEVLLAHVVGRVRLVRPSVALVVATSSSAPDDAIVDFCERSRIACFRGSEADVLARYADCAALYRFDHVVRLTADNPFTDVAELGRLIELHVTEAADYSHAFGQLPIGVGAEIFRREALERAARLGTAANHREHVNEYILEHPAEFRVSTLLVPESKRASSVRLTVDVPDDLRRARWIARESSTRYVETEEAIRLATAYEACSRAGEFVDAPRDEGGLR